MFWKSQSSANCRIGDEPMNAHTSTGTPVACTTSTIGAMSETSVRQATFAPIESPFVSRTSVRMCSRARAPAPGRPTSAVSIPRSSIKWRSRTFSSSVGSLTEGLCSPSRRVSSSNWIRPRASPSEAFRSPPSAAFQS